MLGIILTTLKVIGMILLGILGLLVFLIVLVLFVPVPYRVCVSGGPDAEPRLTVLVRIFGIQVYPKKLKKSKKERRIGKRKKRSDSTASDLEPKEIISETESGAVPEAEAVQGEHASDQGEVQSQEKRRMPHKRLGKQSSEKTPGKDFRGIWNRLRTEFTDGGNRRALQLLLAELRYLLRHSGPRSVKADVSFSLGDPANTGYATAALSVCPFSYGKRCRIIPDFETELMYLKGWMDIRGHLRAIHFLCSGARLFLDKDIRSVIRKFKK